MASITITNNDWIRLKSKIKRKYRELTEDDLHYQQGGEEQLLNHLAKRLNREVSYVEFTLKKGLISIENNRL